MAAYGGTKDGGAPGLEGAFLWCRNERVWTFQGVLCLDPPEGSFQGAAQRTGSPSLISKQFCFPQQKGVVGCRK